LTLKRLASAELSWPLPAEMTDTALEAALFAAAGTKQGHRRHAEPDWAEIHRELKRKHVTLAMLWDEYIDRDRDPRGVSLFALRRHGAGDRRPAHRPDPSGTVTFPGKSGHRVMRLLLCLLWGDVTDGGVDPRTTRPNPRMPRVEDLKLLDLMGVIVALYNAHRPNTSLGD
jgi:hypothetical protein